MESRQERDIINQVRFIDSITNEFERRSKLLEPHLEECNSMEQAETIILNHYKFAVRILEALRRENKTMKEKLGQNYAKLIGLGTPYEQVIHQLRETRKELDTYLKIIRDKMISNIRHQNRNQRSRNHRY